VVALLLLLLGVVVVVVIVDVFGTVDVVGVVRWSWLVVVEVASLVVVEESLRCVAVAAAAVAVASIVAVLVVLVVVVLDGEQLAPECNPKQLLQSSTVVHD
jgi:ABC-type multidrug transport system permease subunit